MDNEKGPPIPDYVQRLGDIAGQIVFIFSHSSIASIIFVI
jgi:hypothetical protein